MRALPAPPPSARRYTNAEALEAPVLSANRVADGGTTAAVFVYMSVAGWNPLCSSCHAAVPSAVFPRQADHINWLSGLWGKKGKHRRLSVYSIWLFYARIDFCFDFHLTLISPPPPQPSSLCATFPACLWVSDIKGIWGLPTQLYQTGIPLRSVDTPPKHIPPLTLLWHRLQISCGTLLPLMCLHNFALKNESEATVTWGTCLPGVLVRVTGHFVFQLVCFPPIF